MSRYTRSVLGQLDRIFNRGTVAGLAEGKLLERFVIGRDEAAFAALVARHGPMVLGVCRRLLRDEHEIEDAFQATFLVLVRRAGAIRDGDLVGPWLHGVAHRVAVRARANAARRHARVTDAVEAAQAAAAPPSADIARRELRTVLDEELARLPETLRAPLVLCSLEGLSHEEAARRLRCPVGTVRSRLARARDRLRPRLARRGLAGDDTALAAALAARPVSSALLDTTVKASLDFATRKAAVTSATAAALAEGVLNAMMLANWKLLGAAALASAVVLGAVQTHAFQSGGPAAGQTSDEAASKAGDKQAELLRKVDDLQAALAESTRRNTEMQNQLQTLRAELKALRSAKPSAAGKAARPEDQEAAKEVEKAEGGAKLEVPTNPRYFRLVAAGLMVVSPEGDRVAVYDPRTKRAKSLRLSEDKKTPREVTPITNMGIVGLYVKGPKITRVAVYKPGDSTWYSTDLREPVDEAYPIMTPGLVAYRMKGPKITRVAVFHLSDSTWYAMDLCEPMDEVSPIVANDSVVYTLGRRVYAFSGRAKRWDVIEFPEGTEPMPIVEKGSFRIEGGGHVYIYDNSNETWNDLDLRAILDAAEDEDGAKSQPDPPR